MPLLLAAQLLSAPSPELHRPELHRAAERARAAIITACHIPADRLVIEQDEGSSLYSVALKGSDPLSDAQLACFGDTITRSADKVALSLEDERLSARYDKLAQRSAVANARSMLRREGLLGRLPRFDRHRETLAAFAVRLERLCGVAPRSVLRARGGYLSLRPGTLYLRSRRADREFCAINAAIATGHNPLYVPILPPPPIYLPVLPVPAGPDLPSPIPLREKQP